MADPLRLVAAAVEFGMARHGCGNSRRTATSIALIVVSVICAGAGGGFAVAALFIYLSPIMGTAGAALAVAGALIVIALTAMAVSDYLTGPSRRLDVSQQPDLESLVAGAEGFVRENKGLALAAALVAGLLASDDGSRTRQR